MAEQFYQYRGCLPHWRPEGAIYFVTWRVHKNQTELTPPERSLVYSAIQHFDGQRYRLFAAVVMNDHVHVLVQPKEGFELQSLVHSWKSFSANRMQKNGTRKGAVWQDEYFDRVVRDEEEFFQKLEYILNKPSDHCDHRPAGTPAPLEQVPTPPFHPAVSPADRSAPPPRRTSTGILPSAGSRLRW
jgi:REP-associated tyrosine transposase